MNERERHTARQSVSERDRDRERTRSILRETERAPIVVKRVRVDGGPCIGLDISSPRFGLNPPNSKSGVRQSQVSFTVFHGPVSSEPGTYETVRAQIWIHTGIYVYESRYICTYV